MLDSVLQVNGRRLSALLVAVILLLQFAISFPAGAQTTAVDAATLGLSAEAALLMDADSGLVICERRSRTRMPMASTTKIMTALCVVERIGIDQPVCIDGRAVGVEGSSIYLYEGEWLTVRQLLLGLLLESANDAAVALAYAVCDSMEAFVALMNQRAAQLGCADTHFANPHGLDAEEHYTTAHDLACIARAALAHPVLAEIMSTTRAIIPLCNMVAPDAESSSPSPSDVEHTPAAGTRVLLNHNKMLRYYDGAIGVKTGYTKKSGRCLVSAATRDGLTLIAVTLNAPNDWNDHTALLNYGFSSFERVSLCRAGEYCTLLPVSGGIEQYVHVSCRQTLALTLPATRGDMHCRVELPRFVLAAVAKDQPLGRLVFLCDVDGDGTEEEIASTPLLTIYAVDRLPPPTLWQRLLSLLRQLMLRQTSDEPHFH